MYANANQVKSELKGKQYILAVDRSGSMSIDDVNDEPRWSVMRESVESFASTMEALDPDGIDFTLFNDKTDWQKNVTKSKIVELLSKASPGGGTLLAPVLLKAFELFAGKKNARRTSTHNHSGGDGRLPLRQGRSDSSHR